MYISTPLHCPALPSSLLHLSRTHHHAPPIPFPPLSPPPLQVENRKGAKPDEIDALPIQVADTSLKRISDSGAMPSCTICLEEFEEGCSLKLLPCLHRFHHTCIDNWLRQKANCPVCQRSCKQ